MHPTDYFVFKSRKNILNFSNWNFSSNWENHVFLIFCKMQNYQFAALVKNLWRRKKNVVERKWLSHDFLSWFIGVQIWQKTVLWNYNVTIKFTINCFWHSALHWDAHKLTWELNVWTWNKFWCFYIWYHWKVYFAWIAC